IATWLLILVNAIVFLFELTLPPPALEQLFYLYGIVPARYSHPDWTVWAGLPLDDYWPFFTSMFLHGGWLHIFSNMWTLWIFGDNVEDRMGPVRFVAFFFLFPQSRVIVLVPILFFPFFFELPAATYLAIWALGQVFSGTLSLAGPE